ncbi:SDR family oxidoreductase [Streptomyces sp. NPDC004610]|uniref:SDR family NAD(P)-dependent oxidoreductase n=1 Tax=unclassified Streptomyces TaxID=2593676 RepID=UPI0033AB7B72
MTPMEGRTALVTGAGGGIGLAIAKRLSERGVRVVAVDLKERPAELPEPVHFLVADVSRSETAGDAVGLAMEVTGRLDYLVNAAGVAWFDRDGSVADLSLDVWHRMIDINLNGPMLFARAALSVMRSQRSGSMVHMASLAGLRTSDGPGDAYQVSKAALISLSRGIAMNHAAEGIRSNTICPGAVLSPMISDIYEADPSRRTAMEQRAPLGRLGLPTDIAQAACYLLSDDASFVTGIDLVVDGGLMIRVA